MPMGTWEGWSVNELICPALLMMTVQMVAPARTKILPIKEAMMDIMGFQEALCGTKAGKSSKRPARAGPYGQECG